MLNLSIVLKCGTYAGIHIHLHTLYCINSPRKLESQVEAWWILFFFKIIAWDQAPQWGKKAKKGSTGKMSASEASPAVAWGGETAFSPPQTTPPIFFPFPPNVEPGPRLSKLGLKMLFSLVCQCFEYSVRVLKCMLLTNWGVWADYS